MSDIDTLTKNLTQIVGNLMTMIEKSNTESLIPASQTIKKTSDMTYHDFLEKVLKNKTPLAVNIKKQSYRLQEDLELLLALSGYGQITVKTFEEIANKKKINRTAESLRSRYHEHLFKIQEKEMKQIVSWIEKFGVAGYLSFEENGALRITETDSKDKTDDNKRVRPVSLEQESKKGEKKVAQKIKTVPTNCKELNEVLRIYSKMVNIPVKDLLEKLDKLSGDLVALDSYIETKDERILWSFEEDEILRKGGA